MKYLISTSMCSMPVQLQVTKKNDLPLLDK
jgi:hypothetical protein